MSKVSETPPPGGAFRISEPEKAKAIKEHDRLCEAVKRFLGTELTRSINGDAELFGRPIAETNMSDGQIILLQFCVAIYAQAEKLSNLIVLMDEPENHLHPDAMLKAISEIQRGLRLCVSVPLWQKTNQKQTDTNQKMTPCFGRL
jgi:predicted ATP-dependent endonuclease of OLD family